MGGWMGGTNKGRLPPTGRLGAGGSRALSSRLPNALLWGNIILPLGEYKGSPLRSRSSCMLFIWSATTKKSA